VSDPLDQFAGYPLLVQTEMEAIKAGDTLLCEVVEPLWDTEDVSPDPGQVWLLRDIGGRFWGWVAPRGAAGVGDLVTVTHRAVLPVVILQETSEN
jgi:hypothetical protein